MGVLGLGLGVRVLHGPKKQLEPMQYPHHAYLNYFKVLTMK